MQVIPQQHQRAECSVLAGCGAKDNSELTGQAWLADCSSFDNVSKLEDSRLAHMNGI